MVDYQRVVDDIRSFLHSSDQTYSEALKALAADYAEACNEVNSRLRRCEEYLQKGLRSEAIHFAQAEPFLLDVLVALDFPERKAWEEMAVTYGLAPPPRLRVETAEALNKAYGEERPVEQLLRAHRRLALSRAPVNERLAMLRWLAVADAGNPVWAEDLPEFEKRRLEQMYTELTDALARNDLDTTFALGDELEKNSWSVPPPAELMHLFNVELPRRRHLKLRSTLERITRDLGSAFAAWDVVRGRRLRDEWKQVQQELQLTPQDPLLKQASAALQWLTKKDQQAVQEEAYQAALAELERAFYSGAEIAELQECYFKVRKFKRSIPKELEERYRDRTGAMRTEASRRERYILAAVWAFGVLLLLCLIMWLAWRRH